MKYSTIFLIFLIVCSLILTDCLFKYSNQETKKVQDKCSERGMKAELDSGMRVSWFCYRIDTSNNLVTIHLQKINGEYYFK